MLSKSEYCVRWRMQMRRWITPRADRKDQPCFRQDKPVFGWDQFL